MNSNPLVSVVIPTFNRADLVCEAIESVLQQTYTPLEVIVVDDGSTDDTPHVLSRFLPRIRSLRQDNSGPAAARNYGVSEARGELLAFVDSDDLWLPQKLEQQVRLLAKLGDSVSCCLCDARVQSPGKADTTVFLISSIRSSVERAVLANPAEILATRFVLFTQMALIPRIAWDKAGGFDHSLRYLEDYDLAFKLAQQGPWALLQTPLVIYRQGSAGSLARESTQRRLKMKQHETQILSGMLANLPNSAANASIRRHLLRRFRMFQLGFFAARWMEAPSAPLRTFGAALDHLLKFVYALFRKSVWCPKPKLTPVLSEPVELQTQPITSNRMQSRPASVSN